MKINKIYIYDEEKYWQQNIFTFSLHARITNENNRKQFFLGWDMIYKNDTTRFHNQMFN